MNTDYRVKFKNLLASKKNLLVVGASSPVEVLAMQAAGFEAAYLSGAALSIKKGFLDEGDLSLEEVAREAREIMRGADIPLIVDCDTVRLSAKTESYKSYEEVEAIERMVFVLENAGVAAVQIEDQVSAKKRCGHLAGKELISMDDMFWKVRIASLKKKNLAVIARTDARAVEGLEFAIWRAHQYISAGADMIFPEALESLEEFIEFRKAVDSVPLVANLTTHGKTPSSISAEHLFGAGYQIVLLPVPQRILFKKFEEILKEARHYGSLTAPVMRGEMSSRDQINDFIKKNSKVYKK